MSDPERLLQDARALSEPERRALEAARDIRPPSSFAGGAWTALSAKLPGAVGVAGTSSVLGAGTVKALVVGAVLGVAAVGGRAIWPTATPATTPLTEPASLEVHPTPPPAAPPALPSQARAVEPTEPLAPASEPSTVVRGSPSRVEPTVRPSPSEGPSESLGSRASAVGNTPGEAPTGTEVSRVAPGIANPTSLIDAREESRLVSAAREALRSGASARALALLEESRQRFPTGTLQQEREALTIEALAGTGQRAVAIERGRAFARDYPGSPYTARVQKILSTASP